MVKELLKAGWKLNDILDSPMYYLIEVLNEKKEIKKEEKSLIAAFTGG
ncbi:phage tail assembly chaperone GT [Planococcus kocurii]